MTKPSARRAGTAALLTLPAALFAYFGFNSGGMFEVTTAFGAVAVLVAAALAVSLLPLRGPGRLGAGAIALLAGFCAWTLASLAWADAGSRVLVAFDRALLYLAVFALFASLGRSEARLRWALRALLAAGAAVALAALASRLLPALVPTAPGLAWDRLSYPLTYWNTLGLAVGLTTLVAVHHCADEREPAAVRCLAAALLPPLAATLLLTFSRGAIGVTVLGAVVYLCAARPRGLPGALLAAGPALAVALVATYRASLVHQGMPLSAASLSQAHRLALVLAAAALGAALLRALTLRLDVRVAALARPAPRPRAVLAAAVAGLALLAAVAVAVGAPGAVERRLEGAGQGPIAYGEDSQTTRLLDADNDGREPLWRVARGSLSAQPLRGTGAGTYQLSWERHGREGPDRLYAYSLYLEVPAELGLVGGALLFAGLLTIFVGVALGIRGPGRAAPAIVLALLLAWAVHAGLDIDWQTPAVTAPVLALAGLALGRRRRADRADQGAARSAWWRPALALACVGLALVPALIALAEHDSRAAVTALGREDCASARADAEGAISAFETGPRPFEVLAICEARAGRFGAALSHAREAVARDPQSWEPHVALALVQARAGADPRAEMRRAVVLYPRRRLPREALAELDASGRAGWPRVALSIPFGLN